MTGKLRVTPDKLREEAGQLQKERAGLDGILNDARTTVQSLKNDWQSEAADAYTTRFSGLNKDIEAILKQVDDYATELNKVADVYQSAENSAKQTAEGLSTDGFK